MKRLSSLQKAVIDFVEAEEGPFVLNELLDHLKVEGLAKRSKISSRVTDILHESSLVLSGDEETFFPRRSYFRGASFLVSLTPVEIERKILIPGHRFLPFYSYELKPWECTLKSSGGAPLRRRRVKIPLKDILIYYTLFDLTQLPLFLLADSEENAEAFQKDDPFEEKVGITTYDLGRAHGELDLQNGDGLIMTVEDWSRGTFRFEKISRENREKDPAAVAAWIEKLEKGFDQAFDDMGLPASMDETIAYAFFYAGRELLSNPLLHLGGFLERSEAVEIVGLGNSACLWRKGEKIEDAVFFENRSRLPRGDDDSLEAILDDLGVALSEVEVEAYIRDELFQRHDEPSWVANRILQGRGAGFSNRKQEKAFFRFLFELWEEVEESYNFFADQRSGELRRRALEILDSYLEWLRALDDRGLLPEELPGEAMILVSQQVEKLSALLDALNRIENISEQECVQVGKTLDRLEASLQDSMQSVGEAHPKSPLLHAEKNYSAEAAYRLRVALKDIRPPIWRRIQVPGDFTLADLHYVLQTAMGWHNCHLHEFQIGGIAYSDPEFDVHGELGAEDEGEYTLDEVIQREKMKFLYVYDFGDDWQHVITVEKIIPAEELDPEELSQAVCLKGKRACPPEDCGGAWGYERLLMVLDDPEDPEHEELKEWTGPFEPEAFDLEKINRELRSG